MKSRKIGLAVMLVVLLGSMGAMSWAADKTPKYGGKIVYGAASEPETLDAAAAFDTQAMRFSCMIAETLTRTEENGTIGPALAEKWEVSKDGLSIVFTLRKNVKFHDGTPLDADAVIFNYDRQSNKENPYYQYGDWVWYDWMFKPIIKGVSKVDDYRIKMELHKPFSPLLAHLTISGFGTIVSPTAIKAGKEKVGLAPVGTGPFKFKEWVRGDHITLVANKDYWRGKPYVEEIIARFIPDNAVRAAALEKGEIDLITDFGVETYDQLKKSKNVTVTLGPALNLSFMSLNTKVKPFDDVRVRRAVAHAINIEELVKSLYGPLGEVLSTPIPKALAWAHNPNVKPHKFDPAYSKKLLAEAGLPNGFETEILIYSEPRGYNPAGKELAEVMQGYLIPIGIKTKIKAVPYSEQKVITKTGQGYEMVCTGWYGDDLDPDGFINSFLNSAGAKPPSVNNFARYESSEMDKLLEEGKRLVDTGARKKVYFKAQELAYEDVPNIWINSIKQPYATTKRVQGAKFPATPYSFDFLGRVWVE
jgi:peptide/nickel transport system substrate-binding protein